MNHHDLFLDSGFQINRRQFFGRPLSGLVQHDGWTAQFRSFGTLRSPRVCTTKQLQAGDLFVHERRSQSYRYVGLQARLSEEYGKDLPLK